jgi:hypothetical protein
MAPFAFDDLVEFAADGTVTCAGTALATDPSITWGDREEADPGSLRLAEIIAGCLAENPVEQVRGFLRSLPAPAIAPRVQVYLGDLCRQAGLPPPPPG